MNGPTRRIVGPIAGLLLLLSPGVFAQYDYGGSGSGRSGDGGVVLFVEGAIANPRNVDNVVATINAGGIVHSVIPEWDDDFAGRIGIGYQGAQGNRLVLAFWGFEGESVGTGGESAFEFPIGPTAGNGFEIQTEITAKTVDLYWEIPQAATDNLTLEWAVGLRYADFEETAQGEYFSGLDTYAADKSNQGDMFGARFAGRARYRTGRYSAAVGVGMSFLDGELESAASLTPRPAGAVDFYTTDDGRSGTILDLDVTGNWHSSSDRYVVSLGWEQSVWEDIASDLTRNLPGTVSPLRDRDSVTFSGFKIGVHFLF